MQLLSAYIPMDRRLALAENRALPERTRGTALFADISGFTPLTEALAAELGPQRGAEELTYQLNRIYGALIAEVHGARGSVISFSGDAITCWLDDDDGRRAISCALAMQQALHALGPIVTAGGATFPIAIKVAVALGEVRRFLLGDPAIQVVDVLAGRVLEEVAAAEQHAQKGEVLVTQEVAEGLGERLALLEWRGAAEERYGVVAGLRGEIPAVPWPEISLDGVEEDRLRPWLLPAVYERLRSGQSEFLAELRPATALFLKFEGLDYESDPTVRDKLDAFVRWVQRILARYEGSLIQLSIGDKGSYLFAAFGAPISHGDDGARAVAAALALRAPPSALAIENCQIGLAQGQMRVGAYGSETQRTYGVLGDKTNLAARLMSVAGPHEIRCDYETYVSAQGQWEFEALPSVRVKGKAGLIRVYRPTGEPVKARRHAPGRKNAFVGRAAELIQIRAALDAVMAGQSRIIVLEGEPGIGKSRLLEEMVDQMRRDGISGLIGTAESIEQQTPYRVWRDILSAYFGLDDLPTPAERQAHVRSLAQELVPDQLDRLPLLNDILNLDLPDTELTASLDAAQRPQSVIVLVLALLHAWMRERPLVIVIEDAHWLDSLSWELTQQVARTTTAMDAPLLLVITLRPLSDQSLGAAHLNPIKGLPAAQTISLANMPDDDIVSLVTARLGLLPGTLPGPVSDLVRQRSDGNPFFAEELIFALRDRGLLTIEPDPDAPPGRPANRCVIHPDFIRGGALLPGTLQGLILSRMDALPPDRQLILKVAAVIGRTFAFMPLSYTLNCHAPLVEETLRAQLDEISRRDFTYVEVPEPDLTYVFKHIVTQEVAYQTLLFSQRRQLHRNVAEWYERTFGEQPTRGSEAPQGGPGLEPFYPLLVHHYHFAEDPARELFYARRTGEQAAAQFANAEAARYLSRALELTPEADRLQRFELLLMREQVYSLQGLREPQGRDLDALAALADALGDDAKRATAALRRAQYENALGDYAAAGDAAQAAIARAEQAGATNLRAMGHFNLGLSLWHRGDYETATAHLQQAIAVAEEAGARRVAGDAWLNLGQVAWGQSDWEQAKQHFLHALEIYREIGHRIGEGLAFNNMGIVSAVTRDYAAAQRYFEQTLRISGETGNRRSEGMAHNNLGNIVALSGDYAGAATYFQKVVAISREIGDRQVEASSLTNLAVILDKQGRYDEARPYFDAALAIYRQIGDRRNEGVVLSNLALFCHHTGENQAAFEQAQLAYARAIELGERHLEGEALTYRGHALAELGRLEEAYDSYVNAYALRQEIGETELALESLAGVARCELRQGDRAASLAHVETILAGLNAAWLDGAEEPLRVVLTCLDVLEAHGDPRAAPLLEDAYRQLAEQAERLSEAEARQSFTERIAAHRDLLARYVQRLGGSPAAA